MQIEIEVVMERGRTGYFDPSAAEIDAQSKLSLVQCDGCGLDGRLMVSSNRVGQVWTKRQAMEALDLFRHHGGPEQPEFVDAVKAADWLAGRMPSPIVLPTWDEVDRYGGESEDDGEGMHPLTALLGRFLRYGGDQRP